jgi:outer membrane protein assembly factor BamB
MMGRRQLLRGIAGGAVLGTLARAGAGIPLLPAARLPAAAFTPTFYSHALSLDGSGIVETCSPTLFDLDGDGYPEIIFGTTNRVVTPSGVSYSGKARVYVVRQKDRTKPPEVVASFDVPKLRSDDTNGGAIQGPIAVGLLQPGDPTPYLVFGVAADVGEQQTTSGGVLAYRYRPGSGGAFGSFDLAWRFETQDIREGGARFGRPAPVVSMPLIADLNGDGRNEVFFGSWDHYFYLLDAQGRQLWRFFNRDTIWSSATAVDVDGDGILEAVCGSDISAGGIDPLTGQPTSNGGYVYCFKFAGQFQPPRFANPNDGREQLLWRAGPFPEAIYSSPAAADLDGDGQYEIVVGTGPSFGRSQRQFLGNFVLCLDARTGQEKWRALTNAHGWTSPAIANLLNETNPATGKPRLQVVIASSMDPGQIASTSQLDNDSRLFLIDHQGNHRWSQGGRPGVRVTDYDGQSNFFIYGSPILADYDGDGTVEALIPIGWSIAVVRNGVQVAALRSDFTLASSPVVADLDNDGKLEVVAVGSRLCTPINCVPFSLSNRAWLYSWNLNAPATARRPWPMVRRSASGMATLPLGAAPPARTPLALPPGSTGPQSFDLSLSSLDGPTGFSLELGSTLTTFVTATTLREQVDAIPRPAVRLTVDPSQAPNQGQLQQGQTLTFGGTLTFRPTNPSATLTPSRLELVITLNARQQFVPFGSVRSSL